MSGFDASAKKFTQKALGRVRRTRNDFVENLFQTVIDRTPVATGKLRANWRAASGEAPAGESEGRSGDAAASEIRAAASSLGDRDGEILLVNNLPYARAVEYGAYPTENRTAPAGMVRGALAEAPAILVRAAGKVKSA